MALDNDIDLNVPFVITDEALLSENETTASSNKESYEFEFDLNDPPCLHVEDEDVVDLNHTDQSFPSFDQENEDTVDLNPSSFLPTLDEENNVESFSAEYEDTLTSNTTSKKRGFLTNEERKAIYHLLVKSSHNGILSPGIIVRVASLYNVHRTVIYRIWNQAKETGDACHKKTQNCGRKRVQLDIQRIRDIPLSKRTTIRSLSHALGVSTTSLVRLQKAGVIRRHSNAINPHLTEENMIARLRFCLSMLDDNSMPHDPRFKSMHNVVFIDEKWFYITKKSTNYYLVDDEEEPHRVCKSKNFICKVMFLAAVARPRFDNEKKETFSGKIGIFPFVFEQPARRNNINRMAGTMEKKPITSVTKEVNKMFLIDKVLPAIKNKWPREDVGKTIFIQQDNARTHIDINDEDFCRAASDGEFDIRLTCQPPNSPDLNILDLGFFNAIQCLQQKESMKSINDLIVAVEKSFDAFSTIQSDKIFLTHQSCMVEIMKTKGSKKYKTPHMKKDVLYKQGGLPTQLRCDPSLIQEVTQYLQNAHAS